jgi:hypothetical protein
MRIAAEKTFLSKTKARKILSIVEIRGAIGGEKRDYSVVKRSWLTPGK